MLPTLRRKIVASYFFPYVSLYNDSFNLYGSIFFKKKKLLWYVNVDLLFYTGIVAENNVMSLVP